MPFAETIVSFIDSIAGDFEIYVIKGDQLMKPNNPIKAGYEFVHWLYEGTPLIFPIICLKIHLTMFGRYNLMLIII